MRYLNIDWGKDGPADSEIYSHTVKVIGTAGAADSKLMVKSGLVGCENNWVDKVRGALALRWQLRIKKISGTQKKAKV
jgi:hypothetical protein